MIFGQYLEPQKYYQYKKAQHDSNKNPKNVKSKRRSIEILSNQQQKATF